MRKTGFTTFVAAATALLLALSVRAQVMQHVPADALVVLKFSNLKSTNDKVVRLAQDLGIAALVPQAADPLGAFQAEMGMQQGLDIAGELAFVFIDPSTAGGDPDQALLLFVPVSDYQAFLGNWPDAQVQGDVTQVQISQGKPMFVARRGNYAAMSPSQEILTRPQAAAMSIPPVTSKDMAGKDAVLYVNGKTVRAKLLPELQKARTQIMQEIDREVTRNTARNTGQAFVKYSPVLKAFLNQLLNVAEGALTQTDAAAIGVSLVPEGINFTLLAEFVPGSYAARNLTVGKNTEASLLAGLPEGKYLIYGGNLNEPQIAAKLVGDLFDPVVKQLLAVGPEMKPAGDYVEALKAYISAQKSNSFGLMAPSGALGAEAILQMVAVQAGDAKAMSAAYTRMVNAQAEFMHLLNLPGMEGMRPSYTANAKTLDGVSFDSVTTRIEMNAQNPMAMQQAQMMTMMYGPQGAVVHYGVSGDKMLIVSGVSDQVVSGLIKAAKANASPLADNANLKAVAAQLPKQRVFAAYIAVGDIVTTVLNYARQFGFAMPLQLPPDLPPVGMTISTEGAALRMDAHVPTTLVQSLIAAGMQAQMQMQGGPGAMPPGGGL